MFKMSPCTLCTGYGLKHIGSASSYNSKFTGLVFHVPSVPWKKLWTFVIVPAINYYVFLSDVGMDFS